MICNKCGNTLPDDSEFCQYCGSRIESENEASPKTADVVPDETKEPECSDVTPEAAFIDVYAKGAAKTINTNSQSQPDHENEMDFGFVQKKAPKAQKAKQPKKKYCSRCGSLIDSQSRQCTGCGKKYFKLKKSSATITVLALLLVVLFALNVLQYLQTSRVNEEMLDKIEDLEKRNDKQRDMLVERQDTINRLKAENSDYYSYVVFCELHVELVGDDDTSFYHKYGCLELDASNGFWVFNTEAAESQGYVACPKCH